MQDKTDKIRLQSEIVSKQSRFYDMALGFRSTEIWITDKGPTEKTKEKRISNKKDVSQCKEYYQIQILLCCHKSMS